MLHKNHITRSQRNHIQDCLDTGATFKHIAKRISKDPTTVSREVKRNLSIHVTNKGETPCSRLLRSPFVCNACEKLHKYCGFRKQTYNAKNAEEKYLKLLKEAREGVYVDEEKFKESAELVAKAIERGQHVYHIATTNDLGFSVSSAYRHIHKNNIKVNHCRLPRMVKFKSRKLPKQAYVPKNLKVGRSYADFTALAPESYCEMDTVIGVIGGKTLLTFCDPKTGFAFGKLLNKNTASDVVANLTTIVNKDFRCAFPILLTDNGGEFARVIEMENLGIRMFFCDPLQSWQKPHVEKMHTLVRDILPKGTSFNDLTQQKVDIAFSHINSVARKGIKGKTPYEIFAFSHGVDLAAHLGITRIDADAVIQSKSLLKN